MSHTWSYIDASLGRCTISVVGTEKRYMPIDELQQTWLTSDVTAGRCILAEQGTPRKPPFTTEVPPPSASIPEPIDEEHELIAEAIAAGMSKNDVLGIGRLLFQRDPIKFIANYSSIYNKLGEAQLRLEAQETRITEKNIQIISTAALKEYLLKLCLITEDELTRK